MDFDHRPHFRTTSIGHNTNTTTTTNELFVCFTSRLSSSSSMKLTKSILSPARPARDAAAAASGGPASLSSSLSRRLRSNGSLKGGASPFLSTAGKRRGGGSGFDNPEPSSPKVTCIGQVRVKTKKKKAKQTQIRSLSQRRSGEISFRRTLQQHIPADISNSAGGAHYQPQQNRNQRWVHLPTSICEALRDFSCLFPCKSSCFSREHKPESKLVGPGEENGCGAVFARWLVSVNDGESGKRREIELVVGDGEEEEEMAAGRSSRRHVFEDIEVKDDDRIEIRGRSLEGGGGGGEENGRVSVCIPPKNALLLMRCRSDPMKMASLASRFSWDAQGVCGNDCENVEVEKVEVCEEEGCEGGENEGFEEGGGVVVENDEEHEDLDHLDDEVIPENLESMEDDDKVDELLVSNSEEMVEENEKEDLEQEIGLNEEKLVENEEDEVESNISSFEALLDQENTEDYEDSPFQEENNSPSICHLSPSTETYVEINEISLVPEEEEEALVETENEEKVEEEESNTIVEKDSIFNENWIEPDPETTQQEENEHEKEELNTESMEKPENQDLIEEPKREKILPDCLLLMMCEPKLSMEVSKETWVCSTDFIRWQPPAAAAKACSGDQEPVVKRRLSIDSKLNKPPVRNNCDRAQQQQAARSSCSMATVIEQKLVNAVGYEPFVLTRCKSEPMRTAAAKLMPETCLIWKNAVRKMEPHRRAAVGVGAAGVGY